MTTAIVTVLVAWIGANAAILGFGWWLAGRATRGELRPGEIALGPEWDDEDLEALMRATQEPEPAS